MWNFPEFKKQLVGKSEYVTLKGQLVKYCTTCVNKYIRAWRKNLAVYNSKNHISSLQEPYSKKHKLYISESQRSAFKLQQKTCQHT